MAHVLQHLPGRGIDVDLLAADPEPLHELVRVPQRALARGGAGHRVPEHVPARQPQLVHAATRRAAPAWSRRRPRRRSPPLDAVARRVARPRAGSRRHPRNARRVGGSPGTNGKRGTAAAAPPGDGRLKLRSPRYVSSVRWSCWQSAKLVVRMRSATRRSRSTSACTVRVASVANRADSARSVPFSANSACDRPTPDRSSTRPRPPVPAYT